MTLNHILSSSLFNELFQHNIVSPNGRIIANEQELEEYHEFLKQRSKDSVVSLYAERKSMVDNVQKLLRNEERSKKQLKMLNKLLAELNLELNDVGTLSLSEKSEGPTKYVGPKEPKMSVFEKQVEAELMRVKTLKRDLKIVDDWMQQIKNESPMIARQEDLTDWKEANKKFRQRTRRRMCEMEIFRSELIKHNFADYDEHLKRLLTARKIPGKKEIFRGSPTTADAEPAAVKTEPNTEPSVREDKPKSEVGAVKNETGAAVKSEPDDT